MDSATVLRWHTVTVDPDTSDSNTVSYQSIRISYFKDSSGNLFPEMRGICKKHNLVHCIHAFSRVTRLMA